MNFRNFSLIFLPIVAITIVDGLIKSWVVADKPVLDLYFVTINMAINKGIIGGYLGQFVKPLYQIPLITIGFFLLVAHYFIQLFAPVKSWPFRIAIAVFFGGVFANVVDRFMHGYVVDYLVFRAFGYSTPAFNFADIVQFAGIGLIAVLQFKPSTFDNKHFERLWVSRQFQQRYSLQLVKVGFFLLLVFGVLSYTFVKVAVNEMSAVPQIGDEMVNDFLIFYISTAATFLLFLFLIGKSLSAYVVKPILSFEHYLRNLAAGNYEVFQVEEPEFRYLEKLSDNVRDHIMAMRNKLSGLDAETKVEELDPDRAAKLRPVQAGLRIKIVGAIDENFDFPPVIKSETVTVDLGGLTIFNSMGIRKWLLWTKNLKGVKTMYLENCRSKFVDQASLVVDLIPPYATLQSFFVPYYDDATGESKEIKMVRDVDFDDNAYRLPKVVNTNGEPMKPDVPDTFFTVLHRRRA